MEFPDLEELMRRNSSGRAELDMLQDFRELYALIKATDKLEWHYTRGTVAPQDYTAACQALIAQFRTAYGPVRAAAPSLSAFMATYGETCRRGVQRLETGLPATVEHAGPGGGGAGPLGGGGGAGGGSNSALDASECTETLISLMDALNLNMKAADELITPVGDAVRALNRWHAGTPLRRREAMVAWAGRLGAMRATELLGEEDRRQLQMDTEEVYREFKAALAAAR